MEMKVLNGYQDARLRGGIISVTQHDIDNTQFMFDFTNSGIQMSPTELRYGDTGHREMAIDCPANFVGVKKQQPRLPRPLSTISQGTPSGSPKGTLQLTNSKNRSAVAVQQPTTSGTRSRNGLVENAAAAAADGGGQHQTRSTGTAFERDERDRSERIRRYQEELARKKELEERASQQNELLRASLRGSKKMHDLEERKERLRALGAFEGFDNPNYCSTGEDGVVKQQMLPSKQASVPKMAEHKFGTSIDSQAVGQTSIQDILTSLRQAKNCLSDVQDQQDLNRVAQFVVSERFQRLLRLHNRLVERALIEPALDATALPIRATDVSQSIIDSIATIGSSNRNARELCALLNDPHIRSLLFAYENSLQNKLQPRKSAVDDDEREYLYERASQYGDENVKIVRIQKSADPLGATVRKEGESIIISRIVKGGAAEKSGLLHDGDEILEINGIDIRGKSIDDVCDLMSPLTGVITFLINPSLVQSPVLRRQSDMVMHVRALFSYDPEEDVFIPCRELGISFIKGDILHVLSQDDPNWWQAYRNGEEDQNLAGLIPSKTFQEQKEALKLMLLGDEKERQKKTGCHCTHRPKRKKKKQFYSIASDESDAEEILTYEHVVLYYPQPNRKRPIVMLGPPNVGRQELRERLLKSDFDRFAAAVPHTTRPKRDDEVNGREYHFVSKAAFLEDIAHDRFLEYGEHEKYLFGTSKDAVRQIVHSGKICVLNLHPQSIRVLRASDLKPYFIFVAPPNIQKLRQLCQKQGTKTTQLEREEELKNIIETGRQMEDTYGPFFDMIIVNQDMDRAYDELLAEINRLEIEPQWVPIQWVT